MKKKTVITTEKHEVWIVRQGLEKPAEDGEASKALDSETESLMPVVEDDPVNQGKETKDHDN